MDNLEKNGQIPGKVQSLLRLKQEEIKTINKQTNYSNEILSTIRKEKKNSQENKSAIWWLDRWILPTFREELTPILLKLVQNLQKKKCSQTHSTMPVPRWDHSQTMVFHTHKKKITGKYHRWIQMKTPSTKY